MDVSSAFNYYVAKGLLPYLSNGTGFIMSLFIFYELFFETRNKKFKHKVLLFAFLLFLFNLIGILYNMSLMPDWICPVNEFIYIACLGSGAWLGITELRTKRKILKSSLLGEIKQGLKQTDDKQSKSVLILHEDDLEVIIRVDKTNLKNYEKSQRVVKVLDDIINEKI